MRAVTCLLCAIGQGCNVSTQGKFQPRSMGKEERFVCPTAFWSIELKHKKQPIQYAIVQDYYHILTRAAFKRIARRRAKITDLEISNQGVIALGANVGSFLQK